MPAIAVTGSTGHLGARVARRLAAAGVPQRLLVRDLSRAPVLDGAEPVRAAHGDGEAVRRALEGVEVVLMVSGSESPDRLAEHRTFVDAAKAAGVHQLVYTSFHNAAPDATFTLARDHWATERHIWDSDLAFTFLRDNLYADFLPELAGPDGVIRGPADGGRVSAVARDDIADVATAVLLDRRPHVGKTYDLTGPEELTLAEAARTISEVTGRPLRYEEEGVEEAFASRSQHGAPRWQVEAWVSTYTAIASGELAGVSSAVAELTGHAATSLRELLQRRAA